MAKQKITSAQSKNTFNSMTYFFNPAFTGTSATFADITGMTKTLTTYGGDVLVFFTIPVKMSTNTATISLVVDGTSAYQYQTSTLSTLYIPSMYKVTGLAPGSHTFKLQYSIPGGATFTCTQYESGSMSFIEVGGN